MTAAVQNSSAAFSIPSNSAHLLVIKLPAIQQPGNLITAVIMYAESGENPSAAGVRLAKPHFPIEAWPKSSECPFPTVNDKNYEVSKPTATCEAFREHLQQ